MPEIVVGAPSPRNQFTDPDSGLRFYRIADRDLVSVTSVRRIAGMPFGLHQWAIGKVIDAAIEKSGAINAAYFDLGALALLKSELRAASTAERDRAAALGTAVHDAAAAGTPLAEVAPELRPRLAQYEDWLRASGVEVLASEFQVWNLSVGYAGTVDLLVRQRNGTVRVVDLKTGKGVYSDHALQVTAYSRAEHAGADGLEHVALTALLHEAAAPAILHLSDDGWEYLVLPPDEQLGAWRAFRGLVAFAMWGHTHTAVETFTAARREGAAPIAAAAPADDPGASVAVVDEIVTWTNGVDAAIAVFAEDIASTPWCADFQQHQSQHRQVADEWICDACFAAGNPFGIVPAAADDSRLSPAAFKAMCKAANIKPASLVGLARELWPQVSDMRLLDDVQRGALYAAAVAVPA